VGPFLFKKKKKANEIKETEYITTIREKSNKKKLLQLLLCAVARLGCVLHRVRRCAYFVYAPPSPMKKRSVNWTSDYRGSSEL
jgi:hypothetical protein